MNLELSDEQQALRDTLRRFLAEKAPISPYARAMLDDERGTTDEVWQGLADLGTTGLLVPVEHGGAGMTMVEAGIVAEELGRVVHPGPWLSSAVGAVRALTSLADDDAAAALLAGIADGSTIATVALVEPAGHGTWTEPRTRTESGRDGWTITGKKVEVHDAAAADVLLVVAAGSDGPALLAVDATAPGVARTPQPTIDGTRKQARVTFEAAPARLLGPAPAAALGHVVDDVLVASAADAVGAASAVMQLAIDYAKVREQFGQAIGSFQAVQHLCVDMYETVELARSGVLHALWAADALSGTERHLSAVRAKGFAGRLATVGDIAVQVFGGIGFTWEHDAHLYLKRLLSWSAFLGAPDRYLEELGRELALTVNR